MKKLALLFALPLLAGITLNSFAANHDGQAHAHHPMSQNTLDIRKSLNLSPAMKQHQLANMRSHVEAVQSIVGLLSTGDFDQAAEIAHSKLGLTDEMKKMCGMFGNEQFDQLGLAFHKSGDELGDTLKTKDMSKSLKALNKTMGYCVECHATFRQ